MAIKNQKKKTTSHLIREMKLMMENKPSYTVESYVFNEDDDPEDDGSQDQYLDDEPEMSGHHGMPMAKRDINDRIQQIRKLVLQSLAEIADDPTSTEYDLFKKLLNLCDKTIEIKANGGKSSKGDMNDGF